MAQTNLPLQRSLCLLRHLQRAPASGSTLAAYVQIEVDDEAYGDLQEKAEKKLLENDIKRLREFGCDIHFFDGEYHLVSYGDFSPVGLGEEELDTLAFLGESFGPGAPASGRVQRLLQQIGDWLPPQQRDSLPIRRRRWRLDLRQRDEQPLDARVEQAMERALREGRLLRFAYRSSSRDDETLRHHTVQPWSLFFDPTRGHFYLDAYWLTSAGPLGQYKQEKWQKFRPDKMLADDIEVLPTKRPPLPPKRPQEKLEYLLSPRIVRGGSVTRHFDNMRVHETDAEGWVRVTATTTDLFAAVRFLLTYGPNCKVIGGAAARQEVETLVAGMVALYGGIEENQ